MSRIRTRTLIWLTLSLGCAAVLVAAGVEAASDQRPRVMQSDLDAPGESAAPSKPVETAPRAPEAPAGEAHEADAPKLEGVPSESEVEGGVRPPEPKGAQPSTWRVAAFWMLLPESS